MPETLAVACLKTSETARSTGRNFEEFILERKVCKKAVNCQKSCYKVTRLCFFLSLVKMKHQRLTGIVKA